MYLSRTHLGPFGEDIPQPWLGFEDTLREYEGILGDYRRFGDDSFVIKMPAPVQKVMRGSSGFPATGAPCPGGTT